MSCPEKLMGNVSPQPLWLFCGGGVKKVARVRPMVMELLKRPMALDNWHGLVSSSGNELATYITRHQKKTKKQTLKFKNSMTQHSTTIKIQP